MTTTGPLLKTALFTIIVPGTVTILVPWMLLGGVTRPQNSYLTWLGCIVLTAGAAIYFRCAWEFAVRGLGTPAPIAPTKYLVTTALHRHVRNPMYIGVFLVLIGEAALCHSWKLLAYAGVFCVLVQLFVLFYEEPTLRRQFGASYDEYTRTVPRWIPRLR
jgi:protein-S-isoprenylcysteine O-methyltransferase Ste14